MRIINDILDVSKLEAGKVELESVPVNAGELIEDVAELLSGAAFSSGIEIQSVIDPDLEPWLLSDSVRLGQVLTNLAGNAVKFTESGQVVLRASSELVADDMFRLTLEVQDSGIGLTPEQQTKLFEPFTQADSSTTRRFGGTGLGLSIVKQIVDLMHGTIELRSEFGRGSVFTVTVDCPRSEPPPERNRRASVPDDALADLRGLRVLVVDDNAVNINILKATLINWGMEVESAESGAAALELLRSRATGDRIFHAMILDYYMPGMDGLELAREISGDPQLPTVPMMLLSSAMGGALSEAEFSSAGFSRLVSKPFRQKHLRRALAEMVQPAQTTGTRAAEIPDTQNPAEGRLPVGLRVLIAEDNPVNQRLARAMLAKVGAVSVVAADGAEALHELQERDFDLVLMDCHMPSVDGFEATRRFRQREARAGDGKHMPVIAVTASAMEADEIACREAGMDDFISKPYKLDTLINVLTKWAPRG